jgi:hypothetical protein
MAPLASAIPARPGSHRLQLPGPRGVGIYEACCCTNPRDSPQCCQVAVVTATFLKCGSFKKLLAVETP